MENMFACYPNWIGIFHGMYFEWVQDVCDMVAISDVAARKGFFLLWWTVFHNEKL